MDPLAATPNNKSSSRRVTEGADLLTSLPESLLSQILSLLPTKDAVRTSVLSTKWVDLWTCITKLDLDDTPFLDKGKTKKENVDRFVNFVYKVLLHLHSSSIHTCTLKLSNLNYDPSLPSAWIAALLKRQVQNLHVRNAENAFISSRDLANCCSLVQLVLEMTCTIKVPPSYSLPSVQVLRLDRVKFESNCPTQSKEIVISLPSLKVFEARQCVWFNVTLQAPLLETFTFMLFDHWLTNEDLQQFNDSAIKIYASSSTKFTYRGHLLHDFILIDPPSAFKASVEILIDEYVEERVQKTGFRSRMLLKQFHEAECLKLKLNRFLQDEHDNFSNLPLFGRLVHLEVETVGADTLLNILNNSGILKTLVLKDATFAIDEVVLTSAAAPRCFESCLKVVHFKQFRGLGSECTLAEFVLKNAAVLQKMTISPYWLLRDSHVGLDGVKWKILSFPRSSSVVSIEFVV